METLMHNQLISIGILNLVVAAFIYVIIKEELVLKNNRTVADFVANVWMRNVAAISILQILFIIFKIHTLI